MHAALRKRRERELQESWAIALEVFTARTPVPRIGDGAEPLRDADRFTDRIYSLLRPNGLAGFTGRWFPRRCPTSDEPPAPAVQLLPKPPVASAPDCPVTVEPGEGDDPWALPFRCVFQRRFDLEKTLLKTKVLGIADQTYYRFLPSRCGSRCTVLPLRFLEEGRFERWRLQPPEVFGVQAEETEAAVRDAVNRVNGTLLVLPDRLWKALFAAVPFGRNLSVRVETYPEPIPFSQLQAPKLSCRGIAGYDFYGLGRFDCGAGTLTLYASAIGELAPMRDLSERFAFVLAALLFLAWADFQTDLPVTMDLLVQAGRRNTPPMELDVYAVYFAQRFVEDVLGSGAGRAVLRSALLPDRSDRRVSMLTGLETDPDPAAAFLRALDTWRNEMLRL